MPFTISDSNSDKTGQKNSTGGHTDTPLSYKTADGCNIEEETPLTPHLP